MSMIEPRTDFISEQSTVVRCRTKEGAEALMNALAKRYPNQRGTTITKLRCFDADATEEGLCYRIREVYGNLSIDHCFESYYLGHGYQIVDLLDLCAPPDLGEIQNIFASTADALSALF